MIRIKDATILKSIDWLWIGGVCVALFLIAFATSDYVHDDKTLATALFFDSGAYLSTTCKIIKCFDTSAQPSLADYRSVFESIAVDGLTPVIGAVYCKLTNQTDCSNLIIPMLQMQMGMHVLNSLIVGLIVRTLRSGRLAALAGMLAWGFYPSAIQATGRFLSESPSVLFILVATLAAFHGNVGNGSRVSHYLWILLLGSSCGLLILTKTALSFVALGLLVGATCKNALLNWKQLCTAVCGLVCVLVFYSVALSNSIDRLSIVPMRYSAFNVLASSKQTDGWGRFDINEDSAQIEKNNNVFSCIQRQFQDNPIDMTLLYVRKIPRLWEHPWNDTRLPTAGLGVAHQDWYHQILLVLFILGILSSKKICTSGAPEAMSNLRRIYFLTSIVLVGHLVYIPFVANVRYGFTSMPLIVIIGICALNVVPHMSLPGIAWRVFGIWLLSISMHAIIYYLTPLKAHSWKQVLSAGEFVQRTFIAPNQPNRAEESTSEHRYFVVMDSGVGRFQLKFNGERLKLPAIPLHLVIKNDSLATGYRLFSELTHVDLLELNQWLAVEIPNTMIRWGQKNTVVFSGSTAHPAITGDYMDSDGSIVMPSLNLFSPTYLLNSPMSKEPRLPARFSGELTKATSLFGYEEALSKDMSTKEPETKQGQYRLYFATWTERNTGVETGDSLVLY